MRAQVIVNAIAGFTLLGAGMANAGGRDSSPRPSDKKANTSATSKSDDWRQDLESWLARLEGRFTVKLFIPEKTVCSKMGSGQQGATEICRTTKPETYASAADCHRVEEGAGLQCTFDALKDAAGNSGAGRPVFLLSNQLPHELLFGIDPVARRISATFVDERLPATSANGKLAGDELTFKERCAVETKVVAGSCSWTLWIKAPANGRKILITRSRARSTGVEFRSLSGIEDPHTFELNRVE